MYVHSISTTQANGYVSFFEVENEFEISCSLVDKVSRKIRGQMFLMHFYQNACLIKFKLSF